MTQFTVSRTIRARSSIGRSLSARSIRLLLLLSVMAICRAPILEASNTLPTDLTALSLEDLMDISIYTASKHKQKISEAPASVTVVTRNEIIKYGYRTLADILESVNGFYTTYDRGYHYLGVRGFSRPGDFNTRLLLLINGHRMTENIFDSSLIGTEFLLDVDLIARVEIVRGPSSSLYGTSAFFAVVNVITKRGEDLGGVEISADAGSFGTYKGRFSYGHVFDNALEILISGSLYDSAGQGLYFKEFDDPETNHGLTSKDADQQQFQSAFLNVSYGALALQAGYVSRDKRLPTAAWETVFNGRTVLVDEQVFADLKYEAPLGEHSDVMARVSYSVYDYYGEYPFDYAEEEDDPPDLAINRDVAEGKWWLGEIKLSTDSIRRNKITLGTEWRLNTQQDQENYDQGWEDDPWLDDHRDSSIWALYLQDEIKIRDGILLNVGVRYDYYDTFGGKANPRIALIYQPFDETTIKVLYGKAFRAPNVYELYYNDGDDEDATQKGNADLRPEEITTYEVVAEQTLGKHFRGKVSLYHYKIDNLISEETDPDDELIVYENAHETEANGVEFELMAKLDGDIEGRARYSFSDAKDGKTGNWLTNSPRHMGKLNISFPVVSKKLFGGLELRYVGERKTLQGNISDAFLIANATLSSDRLFKGIEMSLSVYNLFDKRYGDPGSEENEQDIIEQDGRTFRIKFLYRF